MKILTVLGARPQFIKAATVSRAIRDYNISSSNPLREIIVHTGQHYDTKMSDIFFDEMDIPRPNYRLDCGNLGHGAMTGRMLEGLEELILKEKPDLVLVYGDTNSTLAGSLAAKKLHIPIAHVEAGLRSFNMAMPEEVNRILTDRISHYLFCPTETAVRNLVREGFPYPALSNCKQRLLNVGDVMYDATLYYAEKAKQAVSLDQWSVSEKGYALCTIHRAENTDDPTKLLSIFTALQEINNELPVVIPLHPRTHKILNASDKANLLENLIITDPLSYLEIQRLEMSAKFILTDSGGMQKEACFHSVPCITLRDETEWVETVESGWNRLVGSSSMNILDAFQNFQIPSCSTGLNSYGNGQAAAKCVEYFFNLNL